MFTRPIGVISMCDVSGTPSSFERKTDSQSALLLLSCVRIHDVGFYIGTECGISMGLSVEHERVKAMDSLQLAGAFLVLEFCLLEDMALMNYFNSKLDGVQCNHTRSR